MILKGKVAVVTGGASGIGRVTAARFVAEGAAVVVVDRNADGAELVVKELARGGGSAVAGCVDVVDPAAVDAVMNLAGHRHHLHLRARSPGLRASCPRRLRQDRHQDRLTRGATRRDSTGSRVRADRS